MMAAFHYIVNGRLCCAEDILKFITHKHDLTSWLDVDDGESTGVAREHVPVSATTEGTSWSFCMGFPEKLSS